MGESSTKTKSARQKKKTKTKTKSKRWVLELTLESGKALEPPSWTRRLSLGRRMKTYAVVWVNPARKYFTRIDKHGGSNPNWNCKFDFIVKNQNKKFTINIEIYSVAVGLMIKNRLIGSTCFEVQAIPVNEPAGIFRNLEVKRSAAKAKAKAKAGVMHAGWINTRTNVIPYEKPPSPPKMTDEEIEKEFDDMMMKRGLFCVICIE